MKDRRQRKMRKMTKSSRNKSKKGCRTQRDNIRLQELQFLLDGGFTIKVATSAHFTKDKTRTTFEDVFIPLNTETKKTFLSI